MRETQRVFFDTSVWVAAIFSNHGASFYLLNSHAQSTRYGIISSLDVFEEGVETLSKKYPSRVQQFKELYSKVKPILTEPKRATIFTAASLVHPDDAPILAGAIESRSHVFVTLDKKHLLKQSDHILNKTGVRVISPGIFLEELRIV